LAIAHGKPRIRWIHGRIDAEDAVIEPGLSSLSLEKEVPAARIVHNVAVFKPENRAIIPVHHCSPAVLHKSAVRAVATTGACVSEVDRRAIARQILDCDAALGEVRTRKSQADGRRQVNGSFRLNRRTVKK
jgi:hypothetical protein